MTRAGASSAKLLPLLHETTGTYYTQEEIRSVIEYARVRGMEIIPEIDMPGHTRSMIAAYPHLSCFGRKNGVVPVWRHF